MTKAKEPEKMNLLLQCRHSIDVEKRPNPRKVWPDPQMCPTCKRKHRVTEIIGFRTETDRLSAPNAPKWYLKKLKGRKK